MPNGVRVFVPCRGGKNSRTFNRLRRVIIGLGSVIANWGTAAIHTASAGYWIVRSSRTMTTGRMAI